MSFIVIILHKKDYAKLLDTDHLITFLKFHEFLYENVSHLNHYSKFVHK